MSPPPIVSPDFVKLAEAHGLSGVRVTNRTELAAAVAAANEAPGTFVLDCRVEQEDSVYPMVPAGADLGDMIVRPTRVDGQPAEHNPIFETGEDR